VELWSCGAEIPSNRNFVACEREKEKRKFSIMSHDMYSTLSKPIHRIWQGHGQLGKGISGSGSDYELRSVDGGGWLTG
jgi:hypothetical protein